MVVSRHYHRDRVRQNLTTCGFNFERLNNFKFPGFFYTVDKNISNEINKRLLSGNRCMYIVYPEQAPPNKPLTRTSKKKVHMTKIRQTKKSWGDSKGKYFGQSLAYEAIKIYNNSE